MSPYKIEGEDGIPVLFNCQVFKTAREQADEYIERNKDKHLFLYFKDVASEYFSPWVLVGEYNE